MFTEWVIVNTMTKDTAIGWGDNPAEALESVYRSAAEFHLMGRSRKDPDVTVFRCGSIIYKVYEK